MVKQYCKYPAVSCSPLGFTMVNVHQSLVSFISQIRTIMDHNSGSIIRMILDIQRNRASQTYVILLGFVAVGHRHDQQDASWDAHSIGYVLPFGKPTQLLNMAQSKYLIFPINWRFSIGFDASTLGNIPEVAEKPFGHVTEE